MSTFKNIALLEFQSLLQYAKLPSETRLTVTLEDNKLSIELMKQKKSIEAMKKLKGSGNGNLVTVLLQERQKDKLR